ncbi:hypothetical protein P8C59_009391 [Phyllachora maydis]|uniref:2-dehydropantoate 2-reductase n=1 Tax=Phyllachora maydis TaxID=1825666 RepID=A0AAD9ICJ1_9PEZI|nr:hypothetical protein P8C59_009391 [Phyllachora maydis]
MAPITPRLKILSVGGNPVSAFLSWRLQATNACDVTLVWKTGFEHVSQYGISFTSPIFGNERFKPRHVVRVPEEAAARREGPFDYVILCIKALPDVYDLAAVIDSVVTPQHTCILVNTTHSLGVETAIEERFPTNVVLSLVSVAELSQLGQSEFEHKGSTEIWVGPANKNSNIPTAIQEDMAQALSMTLNTGQVDCKVSSNIRQQQFERVIGPIAFHPLTVLFETSSYSVLMEKVGVTQLVHDVVDELLLLATSQGCKFSVDFKDKIIEEFKRTTTENIMWQDYQARRPMEVETYLGSPIRLSQETGTRLPRIETLYAVLHNLNTINRNRPKSDAVAQAPGSPPPGASPALRMSGQGHPRSMSNGPSRRGSLEGTDLEEFSHLVVYDDIPEGGEPDFVPSPQAHDLVLRERELQLRQREMALREQEMRMRRGPPGPGPGPGSRRGGPVMRNGSGMMGAGAMEDDDDDDDYFDPTAGPVPAKIDPDNFDMMSVTSRKNRKAPSATPAQFRKNPEYDTMPARNSRFRPNGTRNRSSQMMNSIPSPLENIMDDPLLGFTSNRYGAVDRGQIHAESRANSLTAAHLIVPQQVEQHAGRGQWPWGRMVEVRYADISESAESTRGPKGGTSVAKATTLRITRVISQHS